MSHRRHACARTALPVVLLGLLPGVAGCSGAASTATPPTASPSTPATSPRSGASPAPTPRVATPGSAQPLAGMVVGVDAGHNGANSTHTAEVTRPVDAGFGTTKECDTTGTETNPGADGSSYSEHAHNFDVANRLATDLRRLGATVVLTRTSDTGVGPCVDQRNAVFRRAHAQLVVSIHADGDMAASARGFHVIHGTRAEGGVQVVTASTELATAVRDAFAATTRMPRSTYVGGGTALSPRSDIAACNLALVPTVMLEAGNMRNPADAALLTSAGFRQREADGLAQGVVAFVASTRR